MEQTLKNQPAWIPEPDISGFQIPNVDKNLINAKQKTNRQATFLLVLKYNI